MTRKSTRGRAPRLATGTESTLSCFPFVHFLTEFCFTIAFLHSLSRSLTLDIDLVRGATWY